MNSSWSIAIEIAWRSLRARSESPPTTGSSMLKPMYMMRWQPPRSAAGCPAFPSSAVSCASPLPVTLDHLVEAVGGDSGGVVVALQELVPVRDAFLLQAEHDLVDEGHDLPGIGEQARLLVARRRPRDGIRLAAGSSDCAPAPSAGSGCSPSACTGRCRPGTSRSDRFFSRHARLRVEAVDLDRNGAKNGIASQ